MNENMPYKMKLRQGDFEVEVQGDKEWVETKFAELAAQKTVVSGAKITGAKSMPGTLGEFLDLKGDPSKHTDSIAVFAYWLFKIDNIASFNVQDILNCYDRTRKPKPTNVNQIINQNVATHILAETPEKKDGLKAWTITRKGEEYVEQMKP